MPELPEVETLKLDLEARLKGRFILRMRVRNPSLRSPIPPELPKLVERRKVSRVERRAKYVLLRFAHGSMVIHLGMSGSVRAERHDAPLRKHDHVEWELADSVLRYHDPRRFGLILWAENPHSHPLLRNAGIEPLGEGFTTDFLLSLCSKSKRPIKTLLMDSSKIAGIGNIYASESLFRAKVLPQRIADTISKREAQAIVRHSRRVLREAIAAGGSSLRDHAYAEGQTGYFQINHRVYGRADQPCPSCGREILRSVIGQRATFHCPECQR